MLFFVLVVELYYTQETISFLILDFIWLKTISMATIGIVPMNREVVSFPVISFEMIKPMQTSHIIKMI